MYYTKRDEQHELLQEVLAANETAADEEDANFRSAGSSQISRGGGTFSSMSGGDEGMYIERRNQANKEKLHHPLFKKFFMPGLKK